MKKIFFLLLFVAVSLNAQQQSGAGRGTTGTVTMDGIGNQATNVIGVSNVATVTVQGNVGITNASQSEIAISNMNIAVISVSTTNNAESAAGDVLFQQIEIASALQASKKSTLNCITLCSHTNLTGINIKLIFTKAPITWAANSAVANIVPSDLTNIIGNYVMSTTNCYYTVLGTNSVWTSFPINMGLTATGTATSVYMYGITGNAITNDSVGTDTYKLTVTKD